MQDHDFDKLFRHKFGQLPGQPADENGWSALAARLNAHQQKQRRWAFPILLPLFFLLSGSNLYWYFAWKTTLESQKPATLPITLLQKDTLVRTTVIYRYDTIYQHITLVKTSPSKGEHLQSMVGATTVSTIHPKLKDDSFSGGANSPMYTNDLRHVEPKRMEDEASSEQITNTVAAMPARTLVQKVSQSDDFAQAAQPVVALVDTIAVAPFPSGNTSATTKTSSKVFGLGRLRVGAFLGWGKPTVSHHQYGAMFGGGMAADVALTHQLRFGINVGYWQGKLKADEKDALPGVKIPDPGIDYRLRYWEAYQIPALSYTFFLKYAIPIHSDWAPVLGLGGQAATTLPFEIEFDFENPVNEVELYLPGQSKSLTRFQGIIALVGVEHAINGHTFFEAEAHCLQHFGKNPGLLDNQIGLKAHLLYQF